MGCKSRSVGSWIALLTVAVTPLSVLTQNPANSGALVAPALIQELRNIAAELSRAGAAAEMEIVRDFLLRVGDDGKQLERIGRDWQRNLGKPVKGKTAATVVPKLRKVIDALAGLLPTMAANQGNELASAILLLDSANAAANQARGLVEHQGRWLDPTAVAWHRNEMRVAALVEQAMALAVQVETKPSSMPVMIALHGSPGTEARVGEVRVIAQMEVGMLQRVLRQAMRAAALSSALRGGPLQVPKLGTRTIVFTGTEDLYQAALTEAVTNGGLSRVEYDDNRVRNMESFVDNRGWRTSRWRTEANYQSLVLWAIVDDLLVVRGVQPCLEAGHLQWLSLNVFGTSMPTVAWLDASGAGKGGRTIAPGSSPFAADALWRSSRNSLHGCRSWLRQLVLQGRNPLWSNSMRDHVGKITDESLLKTTLVTQFLQERGELQTLIEKTAGRADRVAVFEEALDKKLPEFEAEWTAWLLGPPVSKPGLLQCCEATARVALPDARASVVAKVNGLRKLALAGQWPEFEQVALDEELSVGAAAHAGYLVRHKDQQTQWPGAHEEYADREGFSPQGSRAGLRSVIAFTPDPLAAIDQWMGTFYHRLPVLAPGLFGIGIGVSSGVSVMEVGSLVAKPWRDHWVGWPYDGMTAVPLSFVPELPNPVPGEDQSTWGHPVTLQVSLVKQQGDLNVVMQLRAGTAEGEPVDCHFLSPQAPAFPELAPPDAWCLIPKHTLKKNTTYVVVAESKDPPHKISWRFTTR